MFSHMKASSYLNELNFSNISSLLKFNEKKGGSCKKETLHFLHDIQSLDKIPSDVTTRMPL